MSNVDKRKVSTDALETLGQIIGNHEKRDAIHIAVEPIQAKRTLRPGDHVGVNGDCENPVGIVDPFLETIVKTGEWFWLLVYPRKITSLRHVWSHPAFTEVDTKEENKEPEDDRPGLSERENRAKIIAKNEILCFCKEYNLNFDHLMEWAERAAKDNSFYVEKFENITEDITEVHYEEFDKFWRNFTILTGIEPLKNHSIFSCSC